MERATNILQTMLVFTALAHYDVIVLWVNWPILM